MELSLPPSTTPPTFASAILGDGTRAVDAGPSLWFLDAYQEISELANWTMERDHDGRPRIRQGNNGAGFTPSELFSTKPNAQRELSRRLLQRSNELTAAAHDAELAEKHAAARAAEAEDLGELARQTDANPPTGEEGGRPWRVNH